MAAHVRLVRGFRSIEGLPLEFTIQNRGFEQLSRDLCKTDFAEAPILEARVLIYDIGKWIKIDAFTHQLPVGCLRKRELWQFDE